ncbi:MAG: hypothetical protein Q8M29_12815 [Bacteroidota bacterium]|nr:hypothetical protein [Bacteroidota bacterium]
MKFILTALTAFFILSALQSNAGIETGKSLPGYSITKISTDQTLKRTEAVFVFSCFDSNRKKIIRKIKYSYNGQEKTETPDSSGKITLKVKSGKYKFQFFLDSDHEEIYTDSIKAKGKTKTEVTLTFKDAVMYMIEDKPVIYLYPTKNTKVSVKLDLKGEMLFTYPIYNNGWEVEAEPDGTLKQKEQTYSYLFWEGKTEIKKPEIKFEEGFIVNQNDLLNFMEEKLKQMGLSSKEKQDFITYWYPRMSSSNQNYIHFLFNEEFDAYAHLTIKPRPDNLFRIFMIWDPLQGDQKIKVKEQKIESVSRTGFTVIEWGGTEVNYFEEEKN